ncbi:hypothetical protein HB780_25510 [Rhizobium lusitanum]|uniref:hypothetical protein n=1 Tax=Rhizobium lusitanum TaxID=293958 RepID=UPI001609D314|nr:hypothetical protein [Rhizobium lusitanum]QND48917.1 hypothetical protein HB780_25510 [Rhizobium lusitanum]
MFAIDDLCLIRDQLVKIKRSSYFERPLLDHSDSLISLIDYINQNEATISSPIIMEVRRILFSEQMFLSGSVSGEVPYEVVFSLKLALADWGHKNDIITTALLDDQNFYFRPSKGIWKFVANAIPGFQLPTNQYSLIQIAFPRLYRSKPLFAIPLYHELGHFIDMTNRVSEIVLMSMNPTPPQPMVVLNHLREHFADLFAASYCGEVSTGLLMLLAGVQPASFTHPATVARRALVSDFLSGTLNVLIDAFQQALNQLGMPSLQVRYHRPNVAKYFDNMRPVTFSSPNEIHGVYVSGFEYMEDKRQQQTGVWIGQSPKEVVRIVNDLVEKSIRNFDIGERWKNGNP